MDEASNIAQLETTFKDRALNVVHEVQGYYMMRQARSLLDIKRDLLREFHKPKSES
jgi:hypothetical protein